MVLVDDLNARFDSPDGWSSQEVVEHVGALCDAREDLIWSTVTQ